MAVVTVNEDVCKCCSQRMDARPQHIMELDTSPLNKKGDYPAHCKDLDSCIGCAFCATMCPDVAITVEK